MRTSVACVKPRAAVRRNSIFILDQGRAAMPTQNDSAEDIAIRRLREQSNAAIARHDVGPARAILHDDARIIGSNGDLFDGAAEMARAFEERFADPDFVTYIREPISIDVDGATA